MNTPSPEKDSLEALHDLRQTAPADFTRRVMNALPQEPELPLLLSLRRLWPERGRWFLPAFAGAAAMLLLSTLLVLHPAQAPSNRVNVHFEIHAPDAQRVELVGTFTGWQTGQMQLIGPDASGHWTTDVELPAGRHEYSFLVNGQQWVTDPRADVRRADGFGRENAVIEF
jgi:hypothetical protein